MFTYPPICIEESKYAPLKRHRDPTLWSDFSPSANHDDTGRAGPDSVGGYFFNNSGTDTELHFDGRTGSYSGSVDWNQEQLDLSD